MVKNDQTHTPLRDALVLQSLMYIWIAPIKCVKCCLTTVTQFFWKLWEHHYRKHFLHSPNQLSQNNVCQ